MPERSSLDPRHRFVCNRLAVPLPGALLADRARQYQQRGRDMPRERARYGGSGCRGAWQPNSGGGGPLYVHTRANRAGKYHLGTRDWHTETDQLVLVFCERDVCGDVPSVAVAPALAQAYR